jgi:hypothetical protein
LAIAAAVFSWAAGATLLASARSGSTLAYIAGVVGIAAVILTAVNTSLAPQAEAKAHGLAHVGEQGFSTNYFELGRLATDYEKAKPTFRRSGGARSNGTRRCRFRPKRMGNEESRSQEGGAPRATKAARGAAGH